MIKYILFLLMFIFSHSVYTQCPIFDESCLSLIFDSQTSGNWRSKLNICIDHDDEEIVCENYLYRNGAVAIGRKDVPSGFNLAVKGGFYARRLRVELCSEYGWCDYVFDEDYKLLPLLDVKNFIIDNQRLPGFKSESEIVSTEINVEEIKVLQQEKIEELYLYLIDLNNRVNNLK